MLFPTKSAAEKRADFRTGLNSGKIQRFPGAHAPLVSMEIERQGFDGIYISGAALSADLGLPDIGLTTLSEVTQRGRQIARVTSLPAIIDIDTGFGEPMSAARTIQELEELGIAGCHLEDQENPKRCGHLDNKSLIGIDDMARKIMAAADAKTDPNFVLFARTDSRASEGMDAAIDRAKAYVDAGADALFPEAMEDEKEFEIFRKAVDVPMMANMTEFGKSPLLSAQQLENLGYNLVIYPVTTMRLAMGAIRDGLKEVAETGTQSGLVDKMHSRKELYDLIRYQDYNNYDQSVYNFKVRE
ncbi:MAG: methylisocitrate lyase [Rhodospirillaceae bacterium]|nr:methylisocitrate lyase [Rhodospirillaceae bacterium]|tara:strand:- start:5377 stop:6276 length:900 start_codon:yes stop_codon:yes gene_type:complete